MDKVRPPEQTDWMDALTGFVVLVSGSMLTLFVASFLAFR